MYIEFSLNLEVNNLETPNIYKVKLSELKKYIFGFWNGLLSRYEVLSHCGFGVFPWC